jgi:hypothetical protein
MPSRRSGRFGAALLPAEKSEAERSSIPSDDATLVMDFEDEVDVVAKYFSAAVVVRSRRSITRELIRSARARVVA